MSICIYGFHRCLWVFGFLWVSMGVYEYLWVPMGDYGCHGCPWGSWVFKSLWVLYLNLKNIAYLI